MSLDIVKYPEVNVDGNNQFVSKWSAVHHEILFELQRKDYTAVFDINPSDQSQMRISIRLTGNQVSPLSIGDVVYIEHNNGDSGNFTVIAVSQGGIAFVDIQTSFNPIGGGFINDNNSKPDYYALTNIYTIDAENQYVLVGQQINRPSLSGKILVDVSSFLKSKVGYVNDFDYSLLNDKDLSLGGGYNISISENYQNFTGAFSGLSETDIRFFVNSAKQIGDLYGENMGEYVPFYFDAPSGPYPSSKFLSDFETPTYFPGFPFSLGFLYSEYLVGIVTTKEEEAFDINGVSVGSVSSLALENTGSQNVNRLTVLGSYPLTTKSIKVWLESAGVADCLEQVQVGYVAVGFTESICGLPVITPPAPPSEDPVF